MIVVVGSPIGGLLESAVVSAGMAARVALAAAARGSRVELVGRTGDDAVADAVVLHLARGGVGHVALLRDPARPTPLAAATVEPGSLDPAGPSDPDDRPRRPDAVPTGPVLDAADVDLGLRYLTDFGVIVLAEPVDARVVDAVVAAAGWATSRLVLVVPAGGTPPAGLPPDAIVFEAPEADPDGAFAGVVGAFAAALDEGTDAGTAFQASIAADGWTPAEPA